MENLSRNSVLPKIVATIVIVVLLGILGIFGWHRFMQWHEAEVELAVKQEREKQEQQQRRVQQRPDLDWLEEEVEPERAGDVSEERMREVFGEPVFGQPGAEARPYSCHRLDRNIKAFFAYLDKRKKEDSAGFGPEKSIRDIFEQTLADLVKRPPLINDETRDLVSLLRNQAHFFRTLDKSRLELFLGILDSEKDVLEPAMADFYDYYVRQQCCSIRSNGCIPEKSLYEYAGFFLHTLSGKSYLMRRHQVVRTLTRYYSLLILDRANEQGLNRHGIDIRPHIDLVLNDIRGQEHLMLQQQYIGRLQQLKKKYKLT